MFGHPGTIVTRVTKDDVDDQPHPASMNFRDETTEIIEVAVFGIDRAEIVDGIGRAEGAFAIALADRMNGKQPNEINAHRGDSNGTQRIIPPDEQKDRTNRGRSSITPSNVPRSL